MRCFVQKALIAGAFLLVLTAFTPAQQRSTRPDADNRSVAATAIRGTGKVAVVVVGSAAKAAWVTTRFVVRDVAGNFVKGLLLKAAPKVAIYALKKSPKIAVKVLPHAVKLALL